MRSEVEVDLLAPVKSLGTISGRVLVRGRMGRYGGGGRESHQNSDAVL